MEAERAYKWEQIKKNQTITVNVSKAGVENINKSIFRRKLRNWRKSDG